MASTLFGAGNTAAAQVGGAIGGTAGAVVGGVAKMGMGAMVSALMGGRRDPQVQFNYMVEIDGLTLGMFTEASGIKWSMHIDEIKEGGVNHKQQHLLGRAQFDPLVLKRGFVGGDNKLFDMMHKTFDPNTPIQPPRTLVHLVVMARGTNGGLGGKHGLNEVGRLSFYHCFIQEWSGPSFNTKTNDIAVESITFRYDWMEFHPGGPLGQLLDSAVGGAMSLAGGALAGKSISF